MCIIIHHLQSSQLEELQDELKRKEIRWTSSTARLKNRMAELELENGELKEEIRILEKRRLEWMSQARVSKSSSQNGLKSSSEGSIRSSTEVSLHFIVILKISYTFISLTTLITHLRSSRLSARLL